MCSLCPPWLKIKNLVSSVPSAAKIIVILSSILLIQSCAVKKLKKTEEKFTANKILNDPASSYMYKAEINIFDNYFSGLIVIKPKDTGHRIVFLNEIGMKFFDLELTEDSYFVHHIFEAMNKKMFVKLLVSDFKLMLLYSIHDKNIFLTDNTTEDLILKPKKYKELYYFDKLFSLPKSSVRYSLFRKHTFVNYERYEEDIPGQINIEHKNIKFEMILKYLN